MTLFDHPLIDHYEFEQVPLDQDISLMDEKWMVEFEAALVASFDSQETAYSVGYYSAVAARKTSSAAIELSWYPNTYDRFHQIEITLPRSAFVSCIGCWRYDYKPIIFVRGEWLTNLHLRTYSVFAQIDAIGVKNALITGALSRSKLVELRGRIDEIAHDNPEIAFVAFADSLLLKSNYTIGQFDSDTRYTYDPEKILRLLPVLRKAFYEVLGLGIYCVATQGQNEYFEDGLLHIGGSGNHVSLNSLGIPFAQLQSIEHSARRAIGQGVHPASDVYLDQNLLHSLRFEDNFKVSEAIKYKYPAPMRSEPGCYVSLTFEQAECLQSAEKIEAARRRLLIRTETS